MREGRTPTEQFRKSGHSALDCPFSLAPVSPIIQSRPSHPFNPASDLPQFNIGLSILSCGQFSLAHGIGWVKLDWEKLNYIANKMLVSLESLKTSTNSCVTKFYQLPNGASGLSPSGIVGSEGGGKLVGKPPLLITRDTTCPQIIESCPIFTFKKSLFGSPLFKSLQLCNFEPLTWDEKR